jgi:hypothetical protein
MDAMNDDAQTGLTNNDEELALCGICREATQRMAFMDSLEWVCGPCMEEIEESIAARGQPGNDAGHTGGSAVVHEQDRPRAG